MNKAFFAIAAAMALSPLAAQAGPVISGELWGQRLADAGIERVARDDCPPGNMGNYVMKSRTLELCTNNIRSVQQAEQTLAHEATHAVQHCLGWSEGAPGLISVHSFLAGKNPELANKWLTMLNEETVYKKTDVETSAENSSYARVIEQEAYYLEDDPERVYSWLKKACIGKD